MNDRAEANVKQAVPFFHVANIEESVRYYVDGLGFEMTRKWIDEGKLRWCWLQLGDAALMLQEFRKEGRDSWTPEGKVGGGRVGQFHLCGCAGDLSRSHGARDRAIAALRRERDVGCVAFGPGRLQNLL